MRIKKQDVLKALESITLAGEGTNMVESGAIQNVISFADEVIVDVKMNTPAMHIEKRAEADIIAVIKEKVYAAGGGCSRRCV